MSVYQLPKNWITRPLGDVCTLQRGFDLPKRLRKCGKYPLISSSGEIDSHHKFKVNFPGVVTGRSGSIGNVFYIKEDFWPLNTTLYIKDFHGNDERFIYYLLRNFKLEKYKSGAGVPTLNRNHVHDKDVYLTTLKKEQKYIVTLLDKAFAEIDQAIAHTERNLTNARELFDSYLNKVFTQKGKKWQELPLKTTCIVERGSSPRPIKSYLTDANNGVNWIKIGDTKGVEKYITKTKQKITPEGALKSRKVNFGDFILTNSMSYGKPYIMGTTGYIHDGWFVLRLQDSIDAEYFYYLLSAQIVQKQFQNLAAGAIVKNISSVLVKKAILPIPPKTKQIELVKQFNSLSHEVSSLEEIYKNKLTSLNELKQSILQKAFTGQLTTDWVEQQAKML